MIPAGLRTKKNCAGEAQQPLYATDLSSHQRGHPTSTKQQLAKGKQKGKFGPGPKWVPDAKTD
jgi:hypothetical protein